MTLSKVVFSSASDQWGTPKHVYEALDAEFGFTYDPCPLWDGGLISDGLMADWGDVTFCNPPYCDIAIWVKKAWQEWRQGRTVVLLIPSRTDTRWWHDYCMNATEIRFIKGRLKFGAATTNAPFPSAVIVFASQKGGAVNEPWVQTTETCVSCPECAFTFAAHHLWGDQRDTCPACEGLRLEVELAEVKAELAEMEWRQQS